MRKAATVSAGIAAGAVVAGAVGRSLVRRRQGREVAMGSPPPEELDPVVSFDGTRLSVRAAGEAGAPVVLLAHGFSLDLSIWSQTWPSLAGSFRVVAFDHRGHGRSGAPAHGDLSLRSIGRDLAAVIDALPDTPVVVVGHSMGAMAILALAEQRPELIGSRVAGVVLMGAASSELLDGAMGSVTELLRPRLGSFTAAARRVDRLRKAVLASPVDIGGLVARITQFGPDAPREVVDHVVALAERTSSEVWTDGLPELMEMDLRHAVPRITVPSLVLVGEHDRVTPPATAVRLASDLPQGRFALIQGAGHIAMLERPAAVNAELRRFATRVLVGKGAA